MWPQRFRTHGILGTDVDVAVDGVEPTAAAQVNTFAIDQLRELEAELSIYKHTSAMSRWRTGSRNTDGGASSLQKTSATNQVVELALLWQRRSGGAFNPFADELSALWNASAEPSHAAIDSAVAQLQATRIVVEDGFARQLGDCSRFNANAAAKGWVVDKTIDAITSEFPAARVCVSVGGDLAWTGPGTWTVGIENPLRPYDNEPPLQTIELPPGAIATSGSARRTLPGTGHSHLLDPRTGRPAVAIASVSVIADRAANADAAATAAAVMDPEEALTWLGDEHLVQSALVIAADGSSMRTADWPG